MPSTPNANDGAQDDGIDLMAAEYVLGVLDATELRRVRRRLREDSAFAEAVAAWEGYLLPWVADIAPVQPPAQAWSRICSALGLQVAQSQATQTSAINTPVAAPGTRIGFWRGLALGSVALASVCAVALVFVLQRPPEQLPAPPPVVQTTLTQPDMVASIAADDGRAMLVVGLDSRSGSMTLAPAGDMEVPADRTAELWLIPAGGAPQSLGVIDPARAHQMTLPDTVRSGFGPDAVLAVSIEPTGGSPTGQPTGPVVAKGAMHAV